MKTHGLYWLVGFALINVSLAGDPVGWRGSGLGMYPDADPPTEWSAGKNVVWRQEMPSWGNASTVLLGNRLFVTSEPNELICLSKADGRILWRHPVPLSDTWSDDERAEAEKKQKETEQLKKQYDELDDQINRAYGLLKKDPGNADRKKHYKDLRAVQRGVLKEISRNARWARARAEKTNGYTSATPVSDGKNVWVVMGTGVAACFDLEGNRIWIRFAGRPKDPYGHSASPILADGKLVLHLDAMSACNPMTGEELWRTQDAHRGWGTPFPTRIGNTPVLVTGKGQVVRLADGNVLTERLTRLAYASPIVVDGVAYWIQNDGAAFKLLSIGNDKAKTERLWKTAPRKDRYYGSAVLRDGLLYAMTQKNHFSVIDATDGKVVAEKDLPLGRGAAYTSVTLAGKYLYVGNESGKMAVLQPGKGIEVVAVNELDKFRATPVFEGKRMYLRTWKYVYCIGE